MFSVTVFELNNGLPLFFRTHTAARAYHTKLLTGQTGEPRVGGLRASRAYWLEFWVCSAWGYTIGEVWRGSRFRIQGVGVRDAMGTPRGNESLPNPPGVASHSKDASDCAHVCI